MRVDDVLSTTLTALPRRGFAPTRQRGGRSAAAEGPKQKADSILSLRRGGDSDGGEPSHPSNLNSPGEPGVVLESIKDKPPVKDAAVFCRPVKSTVSGDSPLSSPSSPPRSRLDGRRGGLMAEWKAGSSQHRGRGRSSDAEREGRLAAGDATNLGCRAVRLSGISSPAQERA